jgi:RHS repeat-associated protein
MSSDTDVLRFGYDAEGAALMEWNGALYCYMRNAQGDIIGLTDMNGQIVVEYTYDAWGVPLSVTGNLAQTVGQINPLRYRGYCYDTESGLYYLNSRYYDPQMGRFISADANIAAPNGELLGNNLFIYGFNDPVNTIDPQGTWPRWITVCVGAIATVVKAKTSAAEAALTAVVTGALYRLQVIHYDLRQSLNENLPATREEAQEEGWLGPDTDPVGPSSLLHQFTAKIFGENSKYVSPDGLREAIYDKWGNLIADQRDVGTYNFAPAGTWWDNIKHTLLDVFPWLVFGNGDDDPGPLVDTIWMFINRN